MEWTFHHLSPHRAQAPLSFTENLDSQVTTAPGTIAIDERFSTRNEFNGLQLGVVQQTHLKRAWLESMLRVAIGNNSQRTNISGSTTITENGITENFRFGQPITWSTA